MRIFKRSLAKSEPNTDESQKYWGVFRLFRNSGRVLINKEPATAAAAVCMTECPVFSKLNTITNSTDNRSPIVYKLSNQNYSPEVPLSPDPLPLAKNLNSHSSTKNESQGQRQDTAPVNDLPRYEMWQQRKPRFHFGPRQHSNEEGVESEGRGSQTAESTASDHLLTQANKLAFIYQDGKFVEREVIQWPKQPRFLPQQRYRVMEPYASQYGVRYRKRLGSMDRILTKKYRLIYENPIYMLPRKMMEENKIRLMKRHSLKDNPKMFPGPQKIDIAERTQTKIIKKMQERQKIKESKEIVNHFTAAKANAKNTA